MKKRDVPCWLPTRTKPAMIQVFEQFIRHNMTREEMHDFIQFYSADIARLEREQEERMRREAGYNLQSIMIAISTILILTIPVLAIYTFMKY